MLKAHLQYKLSVCLPDDGKPFAVAFSGGGDSLALLHALKDDPRAKFAFIVDHDLRAGSREEALTAKAQAESFGYEVDVLTWAHNSPKTGLQEKARLARYGLLGDACRSRGLAHLLTAHTQNDQAETLLMRYDKKTDWRGAAGMAQASCGALWPQLALVTLLRPALDVSREALRAYNREQGLSWTDDPSNENRNFARIRARDYLAAKPQMKAHLLGAGQEMRRAREKELSYLRKLARETVSVDDNGLIYLSAPTAPELTRHLLQAGSGQGRPIDKVKVKRLHRHMCAPDFKSATLAGAMIARHKGAYVIGRDPVAITGRRDGKLTPRSLSWPLTASVRLWDGRFVCSCAEGEGMAKISSTHAMKDDLSPRQKETLKALPHFARGTLPAFISVDGTLSIGPQKGSKSLAEMRLHAALGGGGCLKPALKLFTV